MAKRKDQIRAVFDTNVVIRHFISFRKGRKDNFNRRVFELWLVRKKIRLLVNREIVDEYIRTIRLILGMEEEQLKQWEQKFLHRQAEIAPSSKRLVSSRDPKDNVFLAVVTGGKADFLITNDLDLLEISEADKRKLKFQIVTPKEFLELWEGLS